MEYNTDNEFLKVDCKNPDDPECLCEACLDFFENGLGLFDDDGENDLLLTEEDR